MRDIKLEKYAKNYQKKNAWRDKWHFKRVDKAKQAMKKAGVPFIPVEAALNIKLIRDNEKYDYGIVSRKKVTAEFVQFMVDQLQSETSAWGDFKYHISGTGTTGESNSDTALETPIGTAREVGTQTEDDADDYQSVATITYGDTYAVTEHAIFNEAYVDGQDNGILMDRSVFAAINVVSGDSIEFTYTLNCTAEA